MKTSKNQTKRNKGNKFKPNRSKAHSRKTRVKMQQKQDNIFRKSSWVGGKRCCEEWAVCWKIRSQRLIFLRLPNKHCSRYNYLVLVRNCFSWFLNTLCNFIGLFTLFFLLWFQYLWCSLDLFHIKYHSARNDHRFYGIAMNGGNSTMSAYSCKPDSDPLLYLLIIIGGP